MTADEVLAEIETAIQILRNEFLGCVCIPDERCSYCETIGQANNVLWTFIEETDRPNV